MRLDANELQELAGFFAKRFPSAADRARFCKAAGVDVDATDHGDAVQSWASVLSAAQNAGRLTTLARTVAAAAPQDENLQAAARELSPKKAAGSSVPTVVMGVGGLVLFAIGFGVAIKLVGGGEGETAGPPNAAAPVAAQAAPAAPAPVADAPAADAPKAAETTAVAEVNTATIAAEPIPAPAERPPAFPPTPVPATVVPPPTVAPPAPKPSGAGDRAHCSGSPGDVVGYWYAGESSPGSQGATITLTRDARIRADYPHAENHHNARAPEKCVLQAGMSVNLSQAPIDASRGHWWVPYAVGDAR